MRVVYYESGWPTNIGNAFIDYGSLHILKTAAPEAKIYCASEMPKWLYMINNQDMKKSIDLTEIMDVDYIVISGMSLCDEFIKAEGPVLKKLYERGVKIIFNGGGGATYSKKEVESFQRFLETIKIECFISRDEESYNNFKDYARYSYNGIDCGFFLSDAFSPAPLIIKDYVIHNFDGKSEPEIEKHGRKILRTNHACFQFLPEDNIRNDALFLIKGRWPFIKRIFNAYTRRVFKESEMLISDIPDDYLHLYANTYAVYSDRVHACVAALSFGKFARLYSNSPRAYLFDRVGAAGIKEHLIKIDQETLKFEKEKHIAFLRRAFLQK